MHVSHTLRMTANGQWGYFTTRQALAAGYGPELHSYHTKCGNWLKISRGLYRLPGYEDSSEAEFVRWSLWAAGQCPEREVIVSHTSALFYYGLTDQKPQCVELYVSQMGSNRKDPHCHLHLQSLPESDTTALNGFRITTPRRTLEDLKPDLILQCRWGSALRLAQQNRLISQAEVSALCGTSFDTRRIDPSTPVMSQPTGQSPEGRQMGGQPMLHASGRDWRPPSRSFTLIEMLVVLAIIGILAALLMPSLQQALESGRSTSCRNNTRQISICIMSYVQDWNGWLPGVNVPFVWLVSDPVYPSWMQSYAGSRGQMKSVVTCPSYRRMWFDSGNYGLSYHWFSYPSWGKPFRKLVSCQRPAQTAFMSDIECESSNTLDPAQIMIGAVEDNISFRHNTEAVLLWGDMHVAGYTLPQPTQSTATFWSGS